MWRDWGCVSARPVHQSTGQLQLCVRSRISTVTEPRHVHRSDATYKLLVRLSTTRVISHLKFRTAGQQWPWPPLAKGGIATWNYWELPHFYRQKNWVLLLRTCWNCLEAPSPKRPRRFFLSSPILDTDQCSWSGVIISFHFPWLCNVKVRQYRNNSGFSNFFKRSVVNLLFIVSLRYIWLDWKFAMLAFTLDACFNTTVCITYLTYSPD